MLPPFAVYQKQRFARPVNFVIELDTVVDECIPGLEPYFTGARSYRAARQQKNRNSTNASRRMTVST